MPNQTPHDQDSRDESGPDGTQREDANHFGIEPIESSETTGASAASPSGSDYFSRSFASSPWQTPSARAEQTLKTQKAALLLDTLSKIKAGERVDLPAPRYQETPMAEMMQEAGLIELISDQEFSTLRRRGRKLETVTRGITEAEERSNTHQPELEALTEKHSSGWRNFWMSAFKSDTLREEQRELREHKGHVDAAGVKLASLVKQREQLGFTAPALEYFVASNQGYLSLTPNGEALLKRLQQDAETLGDITLGEYYPPTPTPVEVEVTTLEAEDTLIAAQAPESLSREDLRLNQKMQLLADVYQDLLEPQLGEVFSDQDQPFLLNVSLAMALKHDSAGEASLTANTIIDALRSQELAELEGFNLVAEIFNRQPAYNITLADFERHFAYMTEEEGHRYGVTTAVEATAIMEMPGEDIAEKILIQEEYRRSLEENGWIYGSHSTCYIGAKLAARGENSLSSAEEHRNLELACIDIGLEDEVDLGYAALILLDTPGTHQHKAVCLADAYHELLENDFSPDPRLYSVAAHIAAMDGDTQDIVLKVAELRDKLQQDYAIDDPFGAASLSLLTDEYKVLPVIDKSSPNASRRSKAGKEHLRD